MLVAGVAPKRYIDRHTIKTEKIVTLNLNTGEIVQLAGLCIAGSCGLFLLGNYGVKGSFRDDGVEEAWFGGITIAGVLSLLVTAAWKAIVIRREIKHDEAIGVAAGEKR